eukprot:349115-Pelagomonas_calceolata.AAC.2
MEPTITMYSQTCFACFTFSTREQHTGIFGLVGLRQWHEGGLVGLRLAERRACGLRQWHKGGPQTGSKRPHVKTTDCWPICKKEERIIACTGMLMGTCTRSACAGCAKAGTFNLHPASLRLLLLMSEVLFTVTKETVKEQPRNCPPSPRPWRWCRWLKTPTMDTKDKVVEMFKGVPWHTSVQAVDKRPHARGAQAAPRGE